MIPPAIVIMVPAMVIMVPPSLGGLWNDSGQRSDNSGATIPKKTARRACGAMWASISLAASVSKAIVPTEGKERMGH